MFVEGRNARIEFHMKEGGKFVLENVDVIMESQEIMMDHYSMGGGMDHQVPLRKEMTFRVMTYNNDDIKFISGGDDKVVLGDEAIRMIHFRRR